MGRFEDERGEMVALLRDRQITDARILKAMETVERHLFVPEPFTGKAYEDSALPIGKGQTISQPYTVAFMTQALGVRPGDKILEIGTGSGYQAAVLAVIGARVFSIERDLELLAGARKLFDRLGYRIATKGGDGTVGWNEFSPYNGIIVTAGAPDVPQPLVRQLAEGAKLVIPVGSLQYQTLIVITRRGEEFERREIEGFKFVPLIGKMGWS
ncbi:MAG TPA: protein-L-isoaspartate(D-aspartate) O-methyltransferase [Bacteroidota bacterium]|nr:protein-L-isoaspartate(D-aspartate) O-methyltransferase [Bacteroidota bacterium]